MPDQTTAVGMERKLAAIFSTDVAGYSRLMGEDEEATIRTLTAYREVISSLIQQYRGRVVDSPGDNLLAEFASVVDAVRCAVEIQEQLKTKNIELPGHRQMNFRIGINLGDVIVEGERLYGDGVNIAARLESLAEPGGICISGTVYDQVETKLPLTYDYQGEQTVKNIAKPVRVYRLRIEESSSPQSIRSQGRSPDEAQRNLGRLPIPGLRSAPSRLRLALAGLVLIAAAALAVHYWFSPLPNTEHLTSSIQPLTPNPQAAPPSLPLPDKPSIIVLPFNNMSGDPEQEYFSDGLTEVLTGDLSKISGLFVIARNSAFTYKGKAVNVREVGKEMGVRYVLEGSVQKTDQRVRIVVQLIEAATGYHVWSGQYDRPFKDIFALQDEIIQEIVTTLHLRVTVHERGLPVGRSSSNVAAYDTLLRGLVSLGRTTKEANAQARELFEKALEIDPQYAEAYAFLARTHWMDWVFSWSSDRPQSLERAFAAASKALMLNDTLPLAHSTLGQVYMWTGKHDQAILEAKRSTFLDPNYAEGYTTLGMILSYAERPLEAIEMLEKAIRLNPHEYFTDLFYLGRAYYLVERYEEANVVLQRAVDRNPNFQPPWVYLAASYSEGGYEAEARATAEEILRLDPDFSLERMKQTVPQKDSATLERILAALRKAGLK